MSIHEYQALSIDGHAVSLSDFAGKLLLIVNVASECGLTPQYEKLEALQRKYESRGFCVLGFPCNQFGSQEPGNELEIKQFCALNYGVSFPMFAKIDVNGEEAHPLFRYLRRCMPVADERGGDDIRWNFTKFLVGADGEVLARYEPRIEPDALEPDIEARL